MKKLLFILLFIPVILQAQTYTGDKFNARTSILSKGTLQANGLFNALNFKTDSGTVKIGLGTGWAKATNNQNILIGSSSGSKITTGGENVFIGYETGKATIDGDDNIFIGYQSGLRNTSGYANNFVGAYSGENNLTGNLNQCFGNNSGAALTTGENNLFLGAYTGTTLKTSSNRLFIDNLSRTDSTGLENKALIKGTFNTTATSQTLTVNGQFDAHNIETNLTSFTTRLGYQSGNTENESATRFNTFMGYKSGYSTSTGGYNTFIGQNSGYFNIDGGSNVQVGSENGVWNKHGSYNTFIGSEVGYSKKYGSSNVYIGRGARYFGVNKSNELVIDNQIRGSTANDSSLVETSALIYGNFSATVANQSLTVNGDFTYDYRHAVAYREAITYTPNIVQNVYFKLLPTFTTSEADGITVAGDSITIVKGGDYLLHFNVTLNGGNGEDWRFKLYKNNAALNGSNHVTTTGAGNYVTLSYFWYIVGLTTGDDLCFKVTNTTNSNDPTITDIKFYIRKEPEN